MQEKLLNELKFCLSLWEKQGYCSFGGHNKCEQCAAPYLIYKLITGQALHGDNFQRLDIKDWKGKLNNICQK